MSVDLRLRNGRAISEEIEVAAFVRLSDVLLEQGSIPPLILRRQPKQDQLVKVIGYATHIIASCKLPVPSVSIYASKLGYSLTGNGRLCFRASQTPGKARTPEWRLAAARSCS